MNVLILDTETAKHNNVDTVYNIAWIIMTKTGKVKVQRSFLVNDVYDTIMEKLKQEGTKWQPDPAYYITKSVIYESQNTAKKSWVKILETLIEDMTAYRITSISAYNVGFDKRVIQGTTELLTGKTGNIKNTIQVLDKRYNVYDIRIGAVNTICTTKKYVNFCVENNFLSINQLELLTRAETLIRYIRNNPFISESHTALEDTQIEAEIMARVLKKQATLTPCEGNPKFFIYNVLPLLSKQNKEKIITIWQKHKNDPSTPNQTKNRIEKLLTQMI